MESSVKEVISDMPDEDPTRAEDRRLIQHLEESLYHERALNLRLVSLLETHGIVFKDAGPIAADDRELRQLPLRTLPSNRKARALRILQERREQDERDGSH